MLLLMVLENLVTLIPSELILPLAGFSAAQGRFDPAFAIAAATMSSSLGGLAWYWGARNYRVTRLQRSVERRGRWLPVSAGELERADAWFKRWGPLAVGVGRALPGVRGVICIPAGLSRMPFWSFLV